MTELLDRARAAGGDRLAAIVESLAATEPPEILEAVVGCVEGLRQAILETLSAEEALRVLCRTTRQLLQNLPPPDPRIEALLAAVETDPRAGIEAPVLARPTRRSLAPAAQRSNLPPEALPEALTATLWENC